MGLVKLHGNTYCNPVENIEIDGVVETATKSFGLRIRELRVARGWTQAKLAEEAALRNLSFRQATVAKIEAGSRPTSVGELVVLADILRVEPGHLLGSDPSAAILMRHRNAEAQAESAETQLVAAAKTLLAAQSELAETADNIDWAMDEIAYLMAGPLAPLQAIIRLAAAEYYAQPKGQIPADYLNAKEQEITDSYLSAYQENLDRDRDSAPWSEYLRSVNGIDQKAT